MSFNAEKMEMLILNECESIEERCEGYKERVKKAIIDILKAEQGHKTQRTLIQKIVNDACHNVGDFLKNSDTDNSVTEVAK